MYRFHARTRSRMPVIKGIWEQYKTELSQIGDLCKMLLVLCYFTRVWVTGFHSLLFVRRFQTLDWKFLLKSKILLPVLLCKSVMPLLNPINTPHLPKVASRWNSLCLLSLQYRKNSVPSSCVTYHDCHSHCSRTCCPLLLLFLRFCFEHSMCFTHVVFSNMRLLSC